MFHLIVINEETGKTEINDRASAICGGTCDEQGATKILGFTHANALEIAKAVIGAEESAKTLKTDPRILIAYAVAKIDDAEVTKE